MHRFFPPFVSGKGAFGLLLVRLVVGAAFIFHGLQKSEHPFTWWQNSDVPGPLQALAVFSEIAGGIALILGLVTPIAAFLIAGVMAVAIFKLHIPAGHPFVAPPLQYSFESPAVYLAVMILFLLMGPGAMSLDASLFQKKSG